VLAMQEAVAHVKVDSSLHDYALEIVNRTRKSEQLALGVSPRGTTHAPARRASPRLPRAAADYCLPFVGGIHFSGASGNSSRANRACASSRRNDSGTSG